MSFGSARSGYGEAMAASGYGVSRYVDCNSALALIGFILFVDILRDIIEDVTTPPPMRRRKRWVGGWWAEPDILTFISEGGSDHLYDALPRLLPPLLENWWDGDVDCVQTRICETNRALTLEYGVAGRVFGTLFSNVMSRVLPGETSAILEAAKEGRRSDQTCASAFPACRIHTHNATSTRLTQGA
ncbi:uncharacterized protein LOC126995758 [Eriocheir sinensis]|uniref:uncharacterized protein LOC126995758 n=1 Tax=Eriocheir sinensis TaxID=95602 RepID=UPI0021C8ED7C|nr:uncharacterized protein LOC126995758 [Eriocheir sinensis]